MHLDTPKFLHMLAQKEEVKREDPSDTMDSAIPKPLEYPFLINCLAIVSTLSLRLPGTNTTNLVSLSTMTINWSIASVFRTAAKSIDISRNLSPGIGNGCNNPE